MGFLTLAEQQSLKINNMILHVVGGGEFVPESARAVEHQVFFIDRIRDNDVAPVYSFAPESLTKTALENMAAGRVPFETGAQELSRAFSKEHVGSSRDGALFIFELGTDIPELKIYSMIKFDYREAIEQSQVNGESLLRRIVTAFIADKKAMQKSAIIRVVDGVAEGLISTRDRMKAPPEITDYFGRFLDVTRSLSNAELSEKAVTALRDIFNQSKAVLPEQNPAQALRCAKSILGLRQQIDEEAIIEAVLQGAGNPEKESLRSELTALTRRKIRSARLGGLEFRPDRTVFRRAPFRRISTMEGVTITYRDGEGGSVQADRHPDGSAVFTITTQQITEDNLVRDPAG